MQVSSNTLFEYLMKQSGGLLEVARTASALGVSRPTVHSYPKRVGGMSLCVCNPSGWRQHLQAHSEKVNG